MSKPNGLFELPPEHVDELQQIRGIGDGFERGLNKLGVYQFSQLAGLSAAEIVWIEAHLPTFHGRIERDDWPGQAAALMAASEHAEWSLRARSAPSISPRIN
jgi:predicted flap endonuclease-1-like 5' DNA nuclease